MTAAAYPWKLSFQRRTNTTQASGQVTESWDTVFQRYGTLRQTSATESVSNDQRGIVESYEIRFPFDSVASQLSSIAWRVIARNQTGETLTLNLTGVDTAAAGRLPEITISAAR